MKCRLIVLFFSLFLSLNLLSSTVAEPEDNGSDPVLDSLYACYHLNKSFDSALFQSCLLAIQHYPELRATTITFRHKNIPTLMAARPTWWSIFRKKERRRYTIVISTNAGNSSEQLLSNMSVKGRTGIIGHEYAHISVYEKLSAPGLVWFGIRYILMKKRIERETDRIAIERGLGTEMLEYSKHIRKSKLASRKYLRNKRKYYLSINEIQQLVEKTL